MWNERPLIEAQSNLRGYLPYHVNLGEYEVMTITFSLFSVRIVSMVNYPRAIVFRAQSQYPARVGECSIIPWSDNHKHRKERCVRNRSEKCDALTCLASVMQVIIPQDYILGSMASSQFQLQICLVKQGVAWQPPVLHEVTIMLSYGH